MASIKDVARLAGVSTATVSLVLNGKGNISEETRQRVLEIVEQLSYTRNVRARNLRDGQSRVIGYAQASLRGAYNPVLERFMHFLVREIENQNRHLLLFTSQDDEDTAAYDDLISGRYVDGFVLSYTIKDDARFQFLHELNMPFVAFGRSLSSMDELVHWVDVDGHAGIYSATEHLIQQGHRQIGIIAWDEASASGQERVSGYQKALSDYGIQSNPDYIIRQTNVIENGLYGASQLMTHATPPTAIVCISDTLAAGVLRWSAQNQHPIAVTGFDDDPIAQFMHPTLTSVQQPLDKVAVRVAQMLINQIERRENPIRSELIPPQLVVRESSLIHSML